MGLYATVMERMGVHHDFRRMVAIMYNSSEYKVKVNSHVVGGEFKPTNGLSQGSPLSPILYLLVLQSFLSLLNTTALQDLSATASQEHEAARCRIFSNFSIDSVGVFLPNPNPK